MISVPEAGLVAEHAAAGAVHERVDHVVREAVRVGRERRRRDDAHQLPVAGRRVLALRALEQPAGDRRRARLRRAALERLDVAEPERLEVRQVEAADGARDVAERVGALVAVFGGVRQRSGARRRRARSRKRAARGYSRAAMDTVLGLIGLAVFIVVRRSRSPPASTWLVVKLTPRAKAARPSRSAAARPATSGRTSSSGVKSRPCASATASYVILPVEHVDAARERRVARDRLGEAVVGDRLDVRAASRSSAPSSR